MKAFLTLLLLHCFTASAVIKYGEYNYLTSAGIPNVPKYLVVGILEGSTEFYFDDSMTAVKIFHDWAKEWEIYFPIIINYIEVFQDETMIFVQPSNVTSGGYIIQLIEGCEYDDQTPEMKCYQKYGVNGEDFIAFDQVNRTWTALHPQAKNIKRIWDTDSGRADYLHYLLTSYWPENLKMALNFSRSTLDRKVLPSISLLQKSPSSPVTCHATGFYPRNALIYWRKGGKEIYDGVENGEILPNNDDYFQISADLDISSIRPEHWSNYDCAFQLQGIQYPVITRLHKMLIKSNYTPKERETLSVETIATLAVVSVLIVAIVVALGIMGYKHKKGNTIPPNLNIELHSCSLEEQMSEPSLDT